jgi:hypothetical protein
LEDECPLKVNDWGLVRYHNALIQKLRSLVNGRLEKTPTSEVWREMAEFHHETERLKTSAHKSHQHLSDYHPITRDLVLESMIGLGSGDYQMTSCTDMVKSMMRRTHPAIKKMMLIMMVNRTTMRSQMLMKKRMKAGQQLAAGRITIKSLTKKQT